ncbi:MAG: hypothetical protein HY903_06425 [Deltaproteobacteria bacterium]|nr:hypothetical protein [Deltaproteobacteria bacterium]
MPRPVAVLVTYRPKKGREAKLLTLVKRHWPAVRAAGLATSTPPKIWSATDKRNGRRYVIEQFEWKSAAAADLAHRTPAVLAIWEPMEAVLDSMEIAVVRAVS